MSENPKNYIYTENYEMKIKKKKKKKCCYSITTTSSLTLAIILIFLIFSLSRDKYLIIDRKIVISILTNLKAIFFVKVKHLAESLIAIFPLLCNFLRPDITGMISSCFPPIFLFYSDTNFFFKNELHLNSRRFCNPKM